MRKKIAIMVIVIILSLANAYGIADTLSKGSRGDDVFALQNQLNDLGYSVGVIDGDFGGKTEKALRDFQRDHGIEETGAFDDATRQALAEALLDVQNRRYEYYLGNYTWEEANARAIGMGGRLVNIDSAEEFEEIQSELLEVGGSNVTFWIGARRDPNAVDASTGFWWVDEQNRTLPEKVERFGNLNPWALNQPNYVTEDGVRENYVQLRYSASEARWVFEDALGTVNEGTQYGYIVEYEGRKGRAVLMPSEIGALKTLSFSREPEYNPPKASDKPLTVLGLSMIDQFLYLKVNASQEPGRECCIQLEFWRDDHGAYRDENLIHNIDKRLYGELKESWIKIAIPQENYEQFVAEPEGVILEAWLYVWDNGQEKTVKTGKHFREKLPLSEAKRGSTAEPNQESGGTLHRVTPFLASDPTACRESQIVEIFGPDGDACAVKTAAGVATYLAPGEYRARLAGAEDIETAFVVSEGACMVGMNDCGSAILTGKVTNQETEEPGDGLEVVVENQGKRYKTITDEDGQYRFEKLAPVESLVYVCGMGVDTDYAGQLVTLRDNERVTWAESLYRPAASVIFFGRVHYGGDEWYKAYFAWGDTATSTEEVPWFIGRSLYVIAEEDVFGKYYNGDSVKPGTTLNIGSNIPAEKIVDFPSMEKWKDYPFEMNESTGISDLLIVHADIEPERIREVNPTFDGFFTGWSDHVAVVDKREALLCTPEAAYYHLLLQHINEGTEMLDDPIFRALLCRRYDIAGFTQTQIGDILTILDNAPRKYRELYLLSIYNYNLEGNFQRRVNDNGEQIPSAFFHRSTNKTNSLNNTLVITDLTDPKFFEATFFHESGHAIELSDVKPEHDMVKEFDMYHVFPQTEKKIEEELEQAVRRRLDNYLDRYEYKRFSTQKLTEKEKQRIIDALINDDLYYDEIEKKRLWNFTDYRANSAVVDDEKLGIAYDVVRKELVKELIDIETNTQSFGTQDASMVSDIYGAVTNNKIHGNFGHPSEKLDDNGNMKPTNFWYDTDGKPADHRFAEAWAEYFSAVIRGDEENMQTNYEYFGPDAPSTSYTIDYMEELATEMHHYYYTKYSDMYANKPVNGYEEE